MLPSQKKKMVYPVVQKEQSLYDPYFSLLARLCLKWLNLLKTVKRMWCRISLLIRIILNIKQVECLHLSMYEVILPPLNHA